MGKYVKKRGRRTSHGAVIALAAVLLILLAAFVMTRGQKDPGDEGGGTRTDPQSGAETELPEQPQDDITDGFPDTDPAADNTEAGIEFSDAAVFPLLLEDGRLEIESLIQYDGLNPDCGDQVGYDVAAITVRNLSDAYLQSAEISMACSNGNMLTFVITDLPAGATVFAFSRENTPVESNAAYGNVTCKAVFDSEANMGEDLIEVSVEGTAVTLRNRTDKDLSNIVVYCHGSLGHQYFGGITYTYPVQTLPANGSTTVEAADCILGLAEVVRVTIN